MSPNIDEYSHLTAGISIWQTGQFEVYKVNPPVFKIVGGLPATWMSPKTDWSYARPEKSMRSEFELGRDFAIANGVRSLDMIRAGRLACLPFSLLGGVCCFVWARAVCGVTGGIIAACLWCLSPMILGHGSFIGGDVAGASVGIAAVYRLRLWLIRSTWSNAILFGVLAGVALLTKFTWFIVLPATVMIAVPVWRLLSGQRRCLTDIVQLTAACVVCLYGINTMYAFDRSFSFLGEIPFYSRLLGPQKSQALAGSAEQRVPEPYHLNRFSGGSLHYVPVPFPICFVQGMDIQRIDFEEPQYSFLLGETRKGGWWYYYLVAWLVKEPVPSLLLLSVSLLVWLRGAVTWTLRQRSSGTAAIRSGPGAVSSGASVAEECEATGSGAGGGIRLGREKMLLLIPVLITLCLVSSQTALNGHFRYALPAFPFCYVIASDVTRFFRRRQVRWLVGLLLLFQGASVLMAGPYWVSWFNSIAGGPERGLEWLGGSSVDWGQNLLAIRHWQEAHRPDPPLRVAIYSFYPASCVGLSYELPPPFVPGKPKMLDRHGRRGPQPGWFAVSARMLNGRTGVVKDSEHREQMGSDALAYFDRLTPVEVIAHTIRIYHITADEAERLRNELEREERGRGKILGEAAAGA